MERFGQGNGHRLVAAGAEIVVVPLVVPQLGEVAAVALVVRRLPQLRRPARLRGGAGVETLLLVTDVFGARASGRDHAGERLAGGVVPVDVLVGEGAEGGQQLGSEEPAL